MERKKKRPDFGGDDEKKGARVPLGVARRGGLEDGLVDEAELLHHAVLERVVPEHHLKLRLLLLASPQRAHRARPEVEVEGIIHRSGRRLFACWSTDSKGVD
jgi:hypothetical protein